MAITTEDLSVYRRRRAVTAVVTVLALALLSVFAWRVYHFASLIQSGEINSTDLSFLSKFSASDAQADVPVPEETQDVVTTDDPSLGSRTAPVTIVEFADFGCPFSREESFVVRAIAAQFPDSVRFVYRDFPITDLHPDAANASEAGECAAEQGRFWDYHDKLYANQSDLSEDALVRYAQELNMNAGQFSRCMASDRNLSEIEADYAAGVEAGVRGTPTFFINGVRVQGAIPQDIMAELVEQFSSSSS